MLFKIFKVLITNFKNPSISIFSAHYNLQYCHPDVRLDPVHNIYNTVIYILHSVSMWGLQWLRYYATNWKVAILIPDDVMEFFVDINFPIALWPWC